MRKSLFFIVLIVLILFYSCNDLTSDRSGLENAPVEISAVEKGAAIAPGQTLEIDYNFSEDAPFMDRLSVTLSNVNGSIVYEDVIETDAFSDFSDFIDLEPEIPSGGYTLRFDFYSLDKLVFSDVREFFITSAFYSINSITSYPPVLYPGGGGLLYADINCSEADCWLRWSFDGEIIAEGSAEEGYRSLEIEAPDHEGVYDLIFEVFPFKPAQNRSYDFKSAVRKEVPVYVNREQKAALNEFQPESSFYDLYHFRGNLINSISGADSERRDFIPVGTPELAVYNGVFGYYFESGEGLETDSLMVPAEDGVLQDFSVMASFIPYFMLAHGESDGYFELFRTGYIDGSLSVSMGVTDLGGLEAAVRFGEISYKLSTEAGLLADGQYCTVGFSVSAADSVLRLSLNLNGEPAAEKTVVPAGPELSVWAAAVSPGGSAYSRLLGGLNPAVLLDEFGVYNESVDPKQYRKAMALEHGKSLLYAEGFDGAGDELVFGSEDAYIENSSLHIKPGGRVYLPSFLPGYEEIILRIETAGFEGDMLEAVFYLDEAQDAEGFASINFEEGLSELSMVFSKDAVIIERSGADKLDLQLTEDFSGVSCGLKNNAAEDYIEVKSVLILRKNLDLSLNEVNISAGINIRS